MFSKLGTPILALSIFAALASTPAIAQYSSGRSSGGGMARSELDDAVAAAKKWESDAILTSVSSPKVDEKGRGETWFYGFYSAKKNGYLNVTVVNGELDNTPVGVGKTDPVVAGFMDSDLVMAAALKDGLKGETPTMLLNGGTWYVTGGTNKGDVILALSAKTGRLIKKNEVQ